MRTSPFLEHRLLNYSTQTFKTALEKNPKQPVVTPAATPVPGKAPAPATSPAPRSTPSTASTATPNNTSAALKVTSGLKPGAAAPDIMVETPGGTIGYSSLEYAPVTDPNTGAVTGVTKLEVAPRKSGVVTSTTELNDLLKSGDITADQFNAARQSLMGGAKGVDPYGFRATALTPAAAKAPVPTTAPMSDQDLTTKATGDREALFAANGLGVGTTLRDLLDKGATKIGWNGDKGAAFNMPDGSRVYFADLNESETDRLVNLYKDTTVDGIKGSLQGQQAGAADASVKDTTTDAITTQNNQNGGAETPGGTPAGNGAPAPMVQRGPSTTRAAIESLIGRVPPTTAKFLQGVLGVLDQRMGAAGIDYADDVALADAEMEQFNSIAGDMLNRADAVQGIAAQLAQSTARDDEAAAEAAKKASLAANETARQLTAIKLNEEKRKLELSNAKKVQSMTNRLAIAGGFGSLGEIKDIEEAQVDGDRAVASFVNDIAMTDKSFLDKALEIDSNYTAQVAQIHRGFADQMLTIVTKYNDRVDEIQQLVFGSQKRRNDAVTSARNRLRDESGKLQDKTLTYLGDARKEAMDRADTLRKEQYQQGKDKWAQTMQYITTYGTQNKEQIAMMEDQLGLPPGTLAGQKTLAELRMIRSSPNGTAAGGQQVADYVTSLRAQIARSNPGYTPEQIDSLVLESTQNNYPGAKNNAYRIAVQNYVNDNNYNPNGDSAGQFLWRGGGDYGPEVTPVSSKPYFVTYKYRPQFENTTVIVGSEEYSELEDL